MIKKNFTLFAIACLISACTPAPQAQEKQEEQEPQEEQKQEEPDLDPFTGSITIPEDHIFYTGKPSFTLHLTNPNKVQATQEITAKFKQTKAKRQILTSRPAASHLRRENQRTSA